MGTGALFHHQELKLEVFKELSSTFNVVGLDTREEDWHSETLVAVDLDGRAEPSAVALGEIARAGLGAALIRLGAARLAEGDPDDLAGLVPEYVTLPRGITGESGEVEWSRDPR